MLDKIIEYTSQDFEHTSQDIAHTSQDFEYTSQDFEYTSEDFRIKQRFTRHSKQTMITIFKASMLKQRVPALHASTSKNVNVYFIIHLF